MKDLNQKYQFEENYDDNTTKGADPTQFVQITNPWDSQGQNNKTGNKKLLIILGVMVVALAMLVGGLMAGRMSQIDKKAILKQDQGVVGVFGDSKGMDPEYCFLDVIDRRDIENIIFLDSLKNAPEEAWDVSEDESGLVKAWYNMDSKTFYIAAKGGVIANENCAGLFAYCSNLEKIDFNDSFITDNVNDMQYLFYKCESLREVVFAGVDTSNVKNMNRMFTECRQLYSADLSEFDTSNVEDMYAMFRNCISLQNVDVSEFDTSNVRTMGRMFEGCNSLTAINSSEFDTTNVTNMLNMFSQCYVLSQLDVSGFDTSNVTNMSRMFSDCMSLKVINVSNFDTSNVTNMSQMFMKCNSVVNLDVSGFDTSNVTKVEGIFRECPGAKGYEEWDLNNAEDSHKMFR